MTSTDLLLSGDPGLGKTLTAEAAAEHLKRPLYSVRWSACLVSCPLIDGLDIRGGAEHQCSRFRSAALSALSDRKSLGCDSPPR